jgi:alkylated DNA nucleotide flippase Atl1
MIWRESCNFTGFQPGGNRIVGAQRRRMRRGQESPWLKFMENKGRSLLEWSENHLLDSFYFFKILSA